jgi:hypothetical protein
MKEPIIKNKQNLQQIMLKELWEASVFDKQTYQLLQKAASSQQKNGNMPHLFTKESFFIL